MNRLRAAVNAVGGGSATSQLSSLLESIGTVVRTHETIRAAFKANEAFQKRMQGQRVKDHVPTKIRDAQSTAFGRTE